MSHRNLSWENLPLIQLPSSRRVMMAQGLTIITFLVVVGYVFFVEFDASVSLPAELISSLGQKEVKSMVNGPVVDVLVNQGDMVKENEVIAYLLFDRDVEKDILDQNEKLKEFSKEIQAVDASDLKLLLPELKLANLNQEELNSSQKKMITLIDELAVLQETRKRITAVDIAPLNTRVSTLAERIEALKQAKPTNSNKAKIENFRDEREKIKAKIFSLLNPTNTKINELKSILEQTTRFITQRLDETIKGHQIKAPTAGQIGSLKLQKGTDVQMNQIVATVTPPNNQLLMQLSISPKDAQRFTDGNTFAFALTDANNRPLGDFVGKVLQNEKLKSQTAGSGQNLVRFSLSDPPGSRKPSSELKFRDGQKIQAHTVFLKKTLFRFLTDKDTKL